MDKLKNCVDALRVWARQSHDPNAQLLAERRINEYLQREIDDLRTSLRQMDNVIMCLSLVEEIVFEICVPQSTCGLVAPN